MIVEEPQILPWEDREAVAWLRAQLEAEGVRILTACQIDRITTRPQGQQLVTSAGILEVEELLVTTGQEPAIAGLNLEAVGVAWSQRKLGVNRKLQTTNPRIYACGAALGGYSLPHIAYYEAQVALKNALFLPLFPVNYGAIPWAVLTDPELARVGLTEDQARQDYGSSIRVLRQFYKGLPLAQIQGETTGFCKLIGDAQGRLLGAHVVGPAASEIIHLLALGIKKKLKMQELAALVQIYPTFSEIVSQTATSWSGLNSENARGEFWQRIFNLRRSWSA
jgi:pyruvate/2-oxoglutarate dehydrogenase complex dihydrolipoamide dehydrogenase (E3) component